MNEHHQPVGRDGRRGEDGGSPNGRASLRWLASRLGVWLWLGRMVLGMAWSDECAAASHQHMNAGAMGSKEGAALYFVNGDRFAATSGYVVSLEKTATGAQAGLHRGLITLAALAATSDFGGPAFDHAALGAHLEVVIDSLEGPAGGRFGFWENQGGEEGTVLTFDVAAGTRGGTNRIVLSESDGSEGVDPYGHVHGRVFTATEAGLYTVGLRLEDTSVSGPGGGPWHGPSEVFRLQFQAGVSVARLEKDAGEDLVVFGATSGFSYQVEATDTLGPGASWVAAGESVRGDDHLQTVRVRGVAVTRFYRLRRRVL